MQPVLSPWAETFEGFLRSVESRAIIVAPFITAQPMHKIISTFRVSHQPHLNLLTNFSVDSLLQGTVDSEAIAQLSREVRTATIRHLPGLHAKAYVADEHTAIVTSGNLTHGSLYRNYEYGIRVTDSDLVRRIASDLLAYGALGTTMSTEELDRIGEVAVQLREKYARQLGSAHSDLKREYEEQLSSTRDALFELRGKPGETTNAILSRTILFLLKDKPLMTQEMHPPN